MSTKAGRLRQKRRKRWRHRRRVSLWKRYEKNLIRSFTRTWFGRRRITRREVESRHRHAPWSLSRLPIAEILRRAAAQIIKPWQDPFDYLEVIVPPRGVSPMAPARQALEEITIMKPGSVGKSEELMGFIR